MNTQYKNVYPLKRIVASIYDGLLLLSVIFILGYLSIYISNGLNWELPEDPSQPILPGWYALLLISFSSWSFFSLFWIRGNKTLGMAVWKIEIYSIEGNKITLTQTFKRFFCNLIIVLMLGIPLLQIYFTKEKVAFNDLVSGTRLRII
jgi:uncharacterized RDD family membrane protein YckC|tara:strand:+ start:17235 stop:17678 length:444 start_codon:yes stop_codon:yes gene_type:complete